MIRHLQDLKRLLDTQTCSPQFIRVSHKHPEAVAQLYFKDHPSLQYREWSSGWSKQAKKSYTYSSSVKRALKKSYLKNMGIFEIYEDLKDTYGEGGLEGETTMGEELLSEKFRSELKALLIRVKTKPRKKELRALGLQIQRLLVRIEGANRPSKTILQQLNLVYIDLIKTLCRYVDIYVKAQSKGMPSWARFRMMSAREREVEQLKYEQPAVYEKLMQERQMRREIEAGIKKKILEDGYEPSRTRLYGQVVQVAKDVRSTVSGIGASAPDDAGRIVMLEKTTKALKGVFDLGLSLDLTINGEVHRVEQILDDGSFQLDPPLPEESEAFEWTARAYEELVYSADGDVTPIGEYLKKRRKEVEAERKLQRIFPQDLEEMRSVKDETLEALLEGREVTYAALTDDLAKQKAVTRIYPCVEIFGERVIAAGRFKGIMLDDMININGRQIEGTAYDYDPKLGRPISLETHEEDGTLKVELPANREPYLTVDGQGRLYLKIPSTREFTPLRNAIRDIAKQSVDVEYVTKSRNSTFRFGPENFIEIRNALGSLAMSESAMRLVRDFFEQQVSESQQAALQNISYYDANSLGGFKEGFDFFKKQKHAMAWLEQRDNSGLLALDTGVGKTLTAVGYLKNLINQNQMSEDDVILFVCPANLRGNLEHEVRQRLKDPETFLGYIETMSYAQFSRQPEDVLDNYYAVVFDEAHHLSSLNSKRARNAMRPHPRKLLMTASPMENDVLDVRILAGIANNEDLTSSEGKQRVREFRDRFCERIGGRTVGIKEDVALKEAMQDWVQGNVFYAHKLDIEEYDLKKLEVETRTVMMSPDMEDEYRREADEIKSVLEGMVRRYRNRDESATDSEIDSAVIKLAGHFKRLNQIVNMPLGQTSPKVVEAASIIRERIENRGRTLLWTDDPEFAETSARQLSEEIPGTDHVAGLSNEIQIWRNGKKVKSYTPRKYTFGDQSYDRSNWRMGIVNHVIKPSQSLVSATLTSAYTTGLNLQEFDTIVHLDRDSFSSEDMKQRTARAYRQGQSAQCREITLDSVFESREDDLDFTLDEIRGIMQNMEAELFDQVIVESQSKATGKEFLSMDQLTTRSKHLDRKVLEHALSPYIKNSPDSTT